MLQDGSVNAMKCFDGSPFKGNFAGQTKTKMSRTYKSSPLPFMGQKRHFISEFVKLIGDFPNNITVVDLFGGSGLLSHTVKRVKPQSRVIYNDYDGFTDRLASIPRTNALIGRIREFTAAIPKNKALPESIRMEILKLIRAEEETTGYVDYLTLSSSLLFSSQYATSYEELAGETFYSKARKGRYDAEGYLDGIEVVHEDYRALYEIYKNMPHVIFLVDPPYLSTDITAYRMSWKLSDYLDVLNVLTGRSFVYFTSDKSGIVELCEWLGRHPDIGNPFAEAGRIDIKTSINYNSTYTDTMIYRKPA